MKNERIYSVLHALPDSGQKVMCFGHETYCCELDMEEKPDWHEVTFSFCVSSYKLKKEMPTNPEETVLEEYSLVEQWEKGTDQGDPHIIGVTQWHAIGES